MSQTRVTVFGNLIDTGDLPTMISNIISPGRLLGNVFQVAGANLLRITPGSVLLPDGVLVLEDTAQTLVVPNSSASAEYTIVYQLEDTRVLGGSPALLRLLSGIKPQSGFTDATVLGWVRYPGGSIPIALEHFIQPFPIRLESRTKEFYYQQLAPFPSAVRPTAEIPGSTSLVYQSFSNLASPQSLNKSFGGLASTRLAGAAFSSPTSIPSSATDYLLVKLLKGTTPLYTYDSRVTPLVANIPATFTKSTGLPFDNFIFGPSEQVTVQSSTGGIVASTPADLALSIENPASTGNWREYSQVVNNELTQTFQNVSALAQTYTLKIPFIVPAQGQPRKLISRLAADFNCIVTYSLVSNGTTIALSPNSGLVSNTGGIATKEFDVPLTSSNLWLPGSTAYIQVALNAQAGRGASFSYFALTLEPTPSLLFA